MKLPAYEFSKHVEQEIEALNDDVLRSKNTPESKRLIEEWRPLSRLALLMKRAGLNVDVEVSDEEEGSQADGVIFVSGYEKTRLEIQLTYSFSYEESMRMELLNNNGHAPGAGPISRDNKTKEISAALVSEDSDAYIINCSDEIIRLYEKKVSKEYETKMILLISFFEFKLKGLPSWAKIYENIEEALSEAKKSFIAVYLFNEASNEIYQVA